HDALPISLNPGVSASHDGAAPVSVDDIPVSPLAIPAVSSAPGSAESSAQAISDKARNVAGSKRNFVILERALVDQRNGALWLQWLRPERSSPRGCRCSREPRNLPPQSRRPR